MIMEEYLINYIKEHPNCTFKEINENVKGSKSLKEHKIVKLSNDNKIVVIGFENGWRHKIPNDNCEYCESPHNLLERKCLDKNCKQIHTICEHCLDENSEIAPT